MTFRLALASLLCVACSVAFGADEFRRTKLPIQQGNFKGSVGLKTSDSVKDFPAEVRAPKGAPNILLILTDDVGFGASSTFGGPVETPTFDRLAKAGLKYNKFHTTALCSPTRAALITGRNHHAVSTGGIMEIGVGYPGYNTLVRKSCGSIGQILKYNGYNTSWFGKNHNVPDWHTSQAGPFDLWPVGLGFEYFYGFVGGDTNQWAPAIVENTRPVEPPHDDPDYNFDEDMADRAIAWLRMQNAVAPEKPFFCYYATGTAHAPHHAPKEWIEKYKDRFDQGWDEARKETFERQKAMGVIPAGTQLTERSKGIPAWESLDDRQKELYARMMEVYAGALSHADHQFGRLVDTIEEMGELDNTLVIYIQGDNGASAEGSPQGLLNEMTFFNNLPEDFDEVYARMDELGGPKTFNHYPIGWAHAMDTPFQWTKQVASHFGGTRNGLVISWPERIKNTGKVCSQFHHVIDIMPTILEATGLPAPDSIDGISQEPINGTSMAYTWDDTEAPSHRQTQYFEMFANRAIYHDGWVACTTPTTPPWVSVADAADVLSGYDWELYHIDDDFSEAENLANKHPDKLADLQRLFYIEAVKYDVLPLDNSKVERLDVSNRPSLTLGREQFEYFEGMTRIPEGSAPDVKNKSFALTAVVNVEGKDTKGVLCTHGGRFCGYALYMLDGKPMFHYNLADVEHYSVKGPDVLEPGEHVITLDFRYDGGGVGKGGTATLSVDGTVVAKEKLPKTIAFRMSLDETFDVGEDTGTAVCDDYQVPFKFTGELERVQVRLSEEKLTEEQLQQFREMQAKAALSR